VGQLTVPTRQQASIPSETTDAQPMHLQASGAPSAATTSTSVASASSPEQQRLETVALGVEEPSRLAATTPSWAALLRLKEPRRWRGSFGDQAEALGARAGQRVFARWLLAPSGRGDALCRQSDHSVSGRHHDEAIAQWVSASGRDRLAHWLACSAMRPRRGFVS